MNWTFVAIGLATMAGIIVLDQKYQLRQPNTVYEFRQDLSTELPIATNDTIKSYFIK